jgi:hypothetical protein
MSQQDKIQYTIDLILTSIGVTGSVLSTLDTIDQLSGILLKFVSIVSFVFLILVNWKKATEQLKKFFGK